MKRNMPSAMSVLLMKQNKQITNLLAKRLLSTGCVRTVPQRMNPLPMTEIHSKSCIGTKLMPTQFFLNKHRYFSQLAFNCWKCGESNKRSSLFCKQCNVLQKPDLELNYFEVVGVELKYDINVNELTTKYRKLQNILHPDRFSNRDKDEIKISEDYSSLVNKAYSTLLHPLSRGLYMLKLKNVFIEEGRKQSSPEFLMEMMEKNEEIDEARDNNQIKLLDSRNKSTLEKLAKKVGDALDSGDLKLAEEILIEMKYYASIDSKIKDLKQKKGFGD